MNKGESLYDIKELTDAIVITPADASNKNYYFEATEKPEAFNKGVAMLGGTYEVKIISEDNSSIFTTITVNVSAPVEYVRVTQNTFQAAIGDNILDLVTPYVVVGPDDATNKSFYLEIPVEASEAITGQRIFPVGGGVIKNIVLSLHHGTYKTTSRDPTGRTNRQL